MWKILELYEVPLKIIRLIIDMYTKNESWLYIEGCYGENYIEINTGVKTRL